jgi:hypothetical protein
LNFNYNLTSLKKQPEVDERKAFPPVTIFPV